MAITVSSKACTMNRSSSIRIQKQQYQRHDVHDGQPRQVVDDLNYVKARYEDATWRMYNRIIDYREKNPLHVDELVSSSGSDNDDDDNTSLSFHKSSIDDSSEIERLMNQRIEGYRKDFVPVQTVETIFNMYHNDYMEQQEIEEGVFDLDL
jgi:hypothetical protein